MVPVQVCSNTKWKITEIRKEVAKEKDAEWSHRRKSKRTRGKEDKRKRNKKKEKGTKGEKESKGQKDKRRKKEGKKKEISYT